MCSDIVNMCSDIVNIVKKRHKPSFIQRLLPPIT
eukprot:COSAG05_NODE_6651_length_926_cov_0.807739_3_plen_33_part_01